jgi:putative transposase
MGKLYDTDLSDAAWALVEPHLPAARPGGRPRGTCLRAVVDAIFYLLRTGCQWRLLPRDFPPRSTVFHYYAAWRRQGVWTRLQWVLHKL